MHIESVVLRNFQCFGDQRTRIILEPGMTAFIGANGVGKTAACQPLQRLFGITSEESSSSCRSWTRVEAARDKRSALSRVSTSETPICLAVNGRALSERARSESKGC